MTDRYAVIGNPVAHSKSPAIHAAFAAATGQDMEYGRVEAPLDGFTATVRRVREEGYRGANVTVPFKEEAFRLADSLSARARAAGAANTLRFDASGIHADNTDGAGLVADLVGNLNFRIGAGSTANAGSTAAGRRVLLVGAGGAARGVLRPLLDQKPASLTIVNRSHGKAVTLANLAALADPNKASPASAGAVIPTVRRYEELAGEHFDLVINATSASLGGELPPLLRDVFAPAALAYDMMYGQGDTPFMFWARGAGAERVSDGLGMLVEQAAEAFLVWRGIRPETAAVLRQLRSG